MINRDTLILGVATGIAAYAVWAALNPQQDTAAPVINSNADLPAPAFDISAIGDSLAFGAASFFNKVSDIMSGGWINTLNTKGAPYKAALANAEKKNGIPANMLARLAYQESRFDPNAYNKGSGATGIMQLVPRWHPTVNATDPYASIDYAAAFLLSLYKKLGTWELALKAYNWGLGNVQNWLRGNATQPLETKLYSAQILADIGMTGATA